MRFRENSKFIDTTPIDSEIVNRGKVDYFGLPILGKITDVKNIELLQQSPFAEIQFNNKGIAYKYVAEKYVENEKLYGRPLYESEYDLIFIDVDVFRQPALYYKEFNRYCPFDETTAPEQYKMYWDLFEYRRINGMTAWAGIDKDGNRRLVHCPGNLYGFLNLGIMMRVPDDVDAIDNESEFEETDEDKLVTDDDVNGAVPLATIDEILSSLGLSNNKVVKKVLDFPAFFDAQYHLAIAKNFARIIGKNFFFLKARRKGCSHFNAFDLFNNIDLNMDMVVVLAAYDKKYLVHGKGLMKMVYMYSDWVNTTTAFTKTRSIKSKEHLRFGYFAPGSSEEDGWKSEALAVSTRNNPDVTIGKDVYEIAYEEMGKLKNFFESFEVTSSTVEAGAYKSGMITGWGTAGTDEANWKDFEDICNNPDKVNNLACNNVWDQNRLGSPTSWMYSHVHALEGTMDYNGNTDWGKAWRIYDKDYEREKKATNGGPTFEKWCAQRANCSLDAFAREGGSIFDKELWTAQRDRLVTDANIYGIRREGKLFEVDGRVILRTNAQLNTDGLEWHPPVEDFPVTKRTDMHGCFVEYFPPYVNPKTGLVPDNMYVGMLDPFSKDKELKDLTIKHSLGSLWIFELPNPFSLSRGGIPVAEFVGRPETTDEFNEQVLFALKKYNAKMLFENNTGDTYRFMKAKNALHHLLKQPEFLYDKEMQGKDGGAYGIRIDDLRKARGAYYAKEILESILYISKDGTPIRVLNFVLSIAACDEFLRWNMQGNFDRVSSWIVGALLIQEILADPNWTIKVQSNSTSSLFDREWFPGGAWQQNKDIFLLDVTANFDKFATATVINDPHQRGFYKEDQNLDVI